MTITAPAPRHIPARWHGGHQALSPCLRVVIHGTVSPCEPGGSVNVARYFQHAARPASAHYISDPTTTVQPVYDHTIAYHAPPNRDTLGYELCDPQTGPRRRWRDAAHRAMLDRAARDVARLCLAYDVPIRRVTWVGLRRGKRGICGHAAVSRAWRQTSHTDPGPGFPWRRFIRAVRREARLLKGDDMPYRDWPKADRDALADDIVSALMHSRWKVKKYDTDPGNKQGEREYQEMIRNTKANAGRAYRTAGRALREVRRLRKEIDK